MSIILVVEDEPNIRKLVNINLIKRGYQVLEAENGQEAIDHLHRQKPALMILDIKLPDLSGWDILDQLPEVPAFPVLVMTASPVDQKVVLKQYPCVVEILIKPFNIDRLMMVAQRALLKT